jgi:hypothetical protein
MKTTTKRTARLEDARRRLEGAYADWNECPTEWNRNEVQKAKAEVEKLGG